MKTKKNRPQKLLIISQKRFFQYYQPAQTSTNLNFCSIKIVLRRTYV